MRQRKEQGDNLRKRIFPNSMISHERNTYDDKSEDLERYAQEMFSKQYGKNGEDHNYEGDSPSYMGRHDFRDTDTDFEVKNKDYKVWLDDDQDSETNGEEVRHRKYRYGKGVPHIKYGQLYDDTVDYIYPNSKSWTQAIRRKHKMNYNGEGEHYDPYSSSIGDEVSISNDEDYNTRQNSMGKDMLDYYTGKSKYTKGKGWD